MRTTLFLLGLLCLIAAFAANQLTRVTIEPSTVKLIAIGGLTLVVAPFIHRYRTA